MSDTPRTKAATRMAFTSEYMVEIDEAEKLERELAEVTKQRDALAEDCKRYRYRDSRMNSASTVTLDQLVFHLFEARRDAKNARKLWRDKATEVGECYGCSHEHGPCYLQRNPELCDVCAAKQPFWEARQQANIRAAVALRRVLNAGKFLSVKRGQYE
jgi:hypothetical protein